MNLIPGKLYLIENRITLYDTSGELNVPDSIQLSLEKFIVMFISSCWVSLTDEASMEEFTVLYKGKILYCGYKAEIKWKRIL